MKNLEIEHKYLIKMPDIQKLSSIYSVKSSSITQTYLKASKSNRRVREKIIDGVAVYYFTEKQDITALVRTENERIISKEEYLEFLKSADTNLQQIKKDRHFFEYDSKIIEIDIFPFWYDYALAEVEIENEFEKVNLPPQLEVVREVTDDKAFRNFSLAKNSNIL